MIGCREAERAIPRAADGGLPLPDQLALDAHVERCDACRALRDRHARIDSALGDLAAPPRARVDLERAVASVRHRAALELDRAPSRRRLAPIAAVGLAAAGLALWLALRPDAPAPSPTPSPGPVAGAAPDGTPVLPRAPDDGVVVVPFADSAAEPAREFVAALAPAFGPAPSRDDAEATLAAAERAAAPGATWHRRRAAERALAAAPVTEAEAAALYLGLRGDALSARRLTDALPRERVGAAAVRALGWLGPDGADGLASALADADLCDAARTALADWSDADAAPLLAEHAALDPTDSARLAALAARGEPGVDRLLALRLRSGERAGALAALVAQRDAAAAVAAVAFGVRPDDARAPLVLDAVAATGAVAALDLVRRCAEEPRTRAAALATLVRLPGPEPLDALVALDAAGRVARAELEAAALDLLARESGRVARWLELGAATPAAERLLDLLLATGEPHAAPALVALAGARALPGEQRLLALQLAARAPVALDPRADADRLAALVAGSARVERRVAAAALAALARVVGVDAALARLSLDRPALRAALARAADEPDTPALARLARELEPYLPLHPVEGEI